MNRRPVEAGQPVPAVHAWLAANWTLAGDTDRGRELLGQVLATGNGGLLAQQAEVAHGPSGER